MRLAVYHPWTYLRGGIERVLVELLHRSRHDWTLYTHHFDADETFPDLAAQRVIQLEPPVSVERRFGPLARAAWRIARTQLPRHGEEALMVTSEGLGDLVALRATVPTTVCCCTPLKILYDPATRDRLSRHSPLQWLALRALGPGFGAVDRRCWRRFSHAFAISEEVVGRLDRAALVPSGPLEVLHPGVDTEKFRPGDAPRTHLLVAGRIMWQKNVELAIDAHRLASGRGLDLELVVAGAVDEKSGPYLAELRRRAEGLAVRFEANPTDAGLVDLYQRAAAVVFTPLNEDWGIVPLEAMASGTPVIAVDAGGPRETVIDGVTGRLVSPEPETFAVEMLAAAGGALDGCRAAARERALEFSWDAFVDRVDDVMELVASTA